MKSDMKEDMKQDMSQDKKMIKKAFGMHDKQEHKGERTNLSSLKKGGMPKFKMRKMAEGGYTDAEATNLMENDVAPKRASTYSGIMASGDTSGWTKDELEALKANEAAESKPARKAAPKSAAKANLTSQGDVRKSEPKDAPADTNSSMADYEPAAKPKAKAPSPGDYSRNGPIGDTVEAVKNLSKSKQGKFAPRAKSERSSDSDSFKYKKGGSVKSHDGCAQRGKTKGTMR